MAAQATGAGKKGLPVNPPPGRTERGLQAHQWFRPGGTRLRGFVLCSPGSNLDLLKPARDSHDTLIAIPRVAPIGPVATHSAAMEAFVPAAFNST